MEKAFDAVVAGHICLDIIPSFPGVTAHEWASVFAPGRLVETGSVTLSTGGAVSNTGLALRKLGIDTVLMGKVGGDLFGEAVLRIVGADQAPFEEGMIVDQDADTSYTIVISLPGVDRMFLHCPGANDSFGAGDIRYDLVSQSRLFHFGYPPLMKRMYESGGAELAELLRRVKESGITTSLDMAVPDPSSAGGHANWLAILRAALPYVDIFLPSIEESLYMFRRDVYEELSRHAGEAGIVPLVTAPLLSDLSKEVLELGAAVAGFKLGHRGLYLCSAGPSRMADLGCAAPSTPSAWAGKELWAPCFKANLAGTTGSGDATIAGFLSGLLRDASLEKSLITAVAVGACNVEAADALTGVRSWDETWRRVRRGWKKLQLSIDADGWHFDKELGVWMGPGYA